MNVRQKAKRYKRLYETLSVRHKGFKCEDHKVDKLKVMRYYPEALIVKEYKDAIKEMIVKDIACNLAENLGKYVDITTEFCPQTNAYLVYGEISVVNRKGD